MKNRNACFRSCSNSLDLKLKSSKKNGRGLAYRVNGFKRRSQRLERSWPDISCRPSSHPQGYRIFARPPLLMTAETASKISRSVRERDPSACTIRIFSKAPPPPPPSDDKWRLLNREREPFLSHRRRESGRQREIRGSAGRRVVI